MSELWLDGAQVWLKSGSITCVQCSPQGRGLDHVRASSNAQRGAVRAEKLSVMVVSTQ